MKLLKYLFLFVVVAVCCGSCDKDEDDPNLRVIVVGNYDSDYGLVNIYTLQDLSAPIYSGNLKAGRFECRLNPGDYKVDPAYGLPCNCQIQSNRVTVVRYINSTTAEVTYE